MTKETTQLKKRLKELELINESHENLNRSLRTELNKHKEETRIRQHNKKEGKKQMTNPRKKQSGYHMEKKVKEGEIRNCLKCDKEFLSMHKFNKICPRCTLVNSKY